MALWDELKQWATDLIVALTSAALQVLKSRVEGLVAQVTGFVPDVQQWFADNVLRLVLEQLDAGVRELKR